LDGDACWDIDRLLRLPGTVNYPNGKKRAAGRIPDLAALIRVKGIQGPQTARPFLV
jgi:hypothetical protein